MPIIRVQVKDKIALNLTPNEKIVCRNSGYKVEFDFDEEWDENVTKTAFFVYNGLSIPVPFNGKVCEIPVLYNATVCKIGVEAGDIKTTTSAYVSCLKAITDEGGEIPAPPKEEVYNKVIELVNEVSVEAVGSAREIKFEISDDYVLSAHLKDKNGEVVSTATVDLPIEKLVASAEYDEEQKAIIFTLQGGEKLIVPITELAHGLDGVGISRIEQTKTSAESGGENEITVFLTDGTTYKFYVRNGLNGKNGIDGANGKDGLNGKDGEDGYTPVKGVDYWTEADKKEITDYVDKEISEFDFVKVVDVLPEIGLVNREYFVRKANPDTNDLFDEYAWINKGTEEAPNWGWEFKGTKKFEVDLSDYQKKTDENLATADKNVAGAINEVNEKADGNANSLTALVEALSELMPEVVRVY